MHLDHSTIYALTALLTIIAGGVTLAAGPTDRVGGWTGYWGLGHVAMGLGSLSFELRSVDLALRVSIGSILMLGGTVLVTQGIRLLAGLTPHGARLIAALLASALVPLLSHDPAHHMLRVAYDDFVMAVADGWVALTAIRLALRERLRTAWILGGLFVVTTTIALARGGLAAGVAAGMDAGIEFTYGTWLAIALAACWPMRGNLPILIAAERAERALTALATRDALTGALNRTGLDRLRARLVGRAALVLIDLDHFKALNDRLGHAEGDRTLTLMAAAVRDAGGIGSRFARLGGDEFLLVLPGRSLAAAAAIADRVRTAIREAVAAGRIGAAAALADLPPVTASIGVASGEIAGDGFGRLLAEADEALYRSKRAGRDRVSLVKAA